MMFRLFASLIAGLGMLLAIGNLEACPFCKSTTAEQIREGIFNAKFSEHFLMLAAPFPVLGLILWLISAAPFEKKGEHPAEHQDIPATNGVQKEGR